VCHRRQTMTNETRRRTAATAILAILAVLFAACGEAGPLDGLGDAFRGFANGDATTSTTVAAVDGGLGAEGLVAASEVLWLNDQIADQAAGSSSDVIAAVRGRQAGSRFVQASRTEVATALPTLEFPSIVPEDTKWVTSQLVYDLDAGNLDLDTAAAFGMWQVEPYTVTEGRVMVLRVGIAADDAPPERSDVTPIIVPDGLSLGWTKAGLRYELFCRNTLSEELCLEVADSFAPLGSLLPLPS
jgi:HAMP domain-containing protein